MSFVQEIQDALKVLDVMIETMKKRGQEFAKARSEYEIAKATRMLALREEGYAITATESLARGDKTVAKKRLDKDVAETLYKTVQEAIQTQKLKIRIMEAQLSREWERAK